MHSSFYISSFLIIIRSVLALSTNEFVLPEPFTGSWLGRLEFSAFGPYSEESYLFSISQAPNGDYLFENNIVYDELAHMGYQRFYVEGTGDSAGSLWYCGRLTNYADFDEITGDDRLNGFKALKVPEAGDTSVTFCVDSDNPDVMPTNNPFKVGCTRCDCANWTLTYDDSTDTLVSQLSMSGSEGHTHSKHMWTTLRRTGPAPTITDDDVAPHGKDFSCDFEEDGRDSGPVDRGDSPLKTHDYLVKKAGMGRGGGCPHMKSRATVPSVPTLTENVMLKKRQADSYDHCYVINEHADFRLAWTLDSENELLHVSISSSSLNDDNTTYVAVGFRPMSRSYSRMLPYQGTGKHMNFAMEGADIVAGSLNGGLRSLYAALYTGPPIPDTSLKISNSSVSLVDGRVVVSFTRPLVGGYLYENYGNDASINTGYADIIWAVGVDTPVDKNSGMEANADSNDSGCEYHNNLRGLRFVNWEDPTIAMVDLWKC